MNKMSLSRIQSLRVAAVLEDISHQLEIIGHSMTAQINKDQGTAPAQEKARLVKVTRDCQIVTQQMAELRLELEEKRSFSSLLQVVEKVLQKKEALENERQAVVELGRTREAVLELQQQIEDNAVKLEKLLRRRSNLREMPASRRVTVKPIVVERPTRKETPEAEKLLEEQLELLRKKLKEERRVHEESERFLQKQHKELCEVLLRWQQSTKATQREKEERLNSVCCKRTLNLDRLMEMKRKFREMERVVMEDKEEQEKLRRQREVAGFATKLQAWWRGCMVRRGLGRFRKVEEDKKSKKKKKGSKKG
ncbi:unnamed protein product [Menidia menidia]|uniref:Dynein regulatory complex protein 9 n=1 Tax=Menidia menidia TaxID=238744 RepID=A0A8S4BPP9_9TELE|nr:unnamed protein product [Menidia menidia]